MAYPVNRPHNEVLVSARFGDLSAPDTIYMVAPIRGRLKRVYSIIFNAITGADCTWYVAKGVDGSALRTVTVTQSGSASGDVDSADLGYMGTSNYFNEGDAIKFVTNGESSTTCQTRLYAVIEGSN